MIEKRKPLACTPPLTEAQAQLRPRLALDHLQQLGERLKGSFTETLANALLNWTLLNEHDSRVELLSLEREAPLYALRARYSREQRELLIRELLALPLRDPGGNDTAMHRALRDLAAPLILEALLANRSGAAALEKP